MALPLALPIETPRLRVRALHSRDLAPLMAVNGDQEVTKHLPYKAWQSLSDAQAWHDRMRGIESGGAALQMVVAYRTDDVAIGTCLLFRHDAEKACIELGFVLGRAHWRTGVMGEAMGALVERAFDELRLERMIAVIERPNVASAALVRRLGFSFEAAEEGEVELDRYALTSRAA